jgi:hypothetical protein
MCFSSDPEQGIRVTRLQCGDQVTIKAGYGRPRSGKDRTEVVVAVHPDMAAMTDSGTILPCRNRADVFIPTGKHFKNVRISKKVRQLLLAGGWPIEK